MRNWYAEAARFLGGWPDSYLVVDCESTGLDTGSPSTLITQIGWALVRDRAIEVKHAFVLDWVGVGGVTSGSYRDAIANVTHAMAARGSEYRVTWPMVLEEGVPAIEGLSGFRGLLEDAQGSGLPIAGHNVVAYDRLLFENTFRRHASPFSFDVERMVDTGLLEKCRKSGWSPPLPGECGRGEWFAAVSRKRSTEKWNLGGACFAEYALEDKIGSSSEMAHDAGFDCVMTHHVIEAMRERSEGA